MSIGRRDEQFEITSFVDVALRRLSRSDVVGVPLQAPEMEWHPVVTLNSDQSRNRLSSQDLVSGVPRPRIEVPHEHVRHSPS